MPNTNTKIRIKRSDDTASALNNETLEYGEPLFLEKSGTKHRYLAIGNSDILEQATFFNGVTNTNLLGKSVYKNSLNIAVDEEENPVSVSRVSVQTLTPSTRDTNYYYLVTQNNGSLYSHNLSNNGIFVTGNGVLHGAAWNDYAEERKCLNGKPGQVVCENGDGSLSISSEKLQPAPYVISDCCGIAIGNVEMIDNTYQTVAVAGRVLVYVNCEVKTGDVLCADKDGYATVMSRQEIANYPDRILGVVGEIPTYTKWNSTVNVDGRVWVTVK